MKVKKTALLIYDSFCNFEISVALEVLALGEKEVTVFGITKAPIKSEEGKIIGAISIAPIMLVKAGFLSGKQFMAGVNKDEIMEEGFSEEELSQMIGWEDNLRKPVLEGCIVTGDIVTSISYNFVKFGLKFGTMLGINLPKETFGI